VLEVNAPLIDEQATHRCLVDRSAAEASAAAAYTAATRVRLASVYAFRPRWRHLARHLLAG
jgi:hypothetical protein